MDKYYQELTRGEMNRRDKRVINNLTLYVLHQNVQSISNRQTNRIRPCVKVESKEYGCVVFYRALGKGGLLKLNSDRSV